MLCAFTFASSNKIMDWVTKLFVFDLISTLVVTARKSILNRSLTVSLCFIFSTTSLALTKLCPSVIGNCSLHYSSLSYFESPCASLTSCPRHGSPSISCTSWSVIFMFPLWSTNMHSFSLKASRTLSANLWGVSHNSKSSKPPNIIVFTHSCCSSDNVEVISHKTLGEFLIFVISSSCRSYKNNEYECSTLY